MASRAASISGVRALAGPWSARDPGSRGNEHVLTTIAHSASPRPDGGFYESLDQVLKEMQWAPPLKPEAQARVEQVVAAQQRAMEAMRAGIDPGGAVTACTFGFPTIMIES